MADFEEILTMWETDSKIDNFSLDSELTKTGNLHAKYIRERATAKLKVHKLDRDYREKREWKRRYFKGDFNNPDDLKRYGVEPYRGSSINVDVENALNSDSELNDILLKKNYNEEIVVVCDAIIRELGNRTFALGSAVKWNIFQSGG